MSFNEFDEHETSEKVRDWLRRNAASMIGGVLLGAGALWGWSWWQGEQLVRHAAAESAYQKLADARAADAAADLADTAPALAKRLRDEHGSSKFATLGALLEAKAAVDRGDLDAARQELDWALERTDEPALGDLVRIRLAELELANGDADRALMLADAVQSSAYRALKAELRGDALAVLGRADDARGAYDDALAALDEGAPSRQIVAMKRDNVVVAAAPAGSAPTVAPTATPAPVAPPAPPAAAPAPAGAP